MGKLGLRGGRPLSGGLRYLGVEETFFGEFVHEPADELHTGQECFSNGALDPSLCQRVNDLVESEEDGVLVSQGRKNKRFVAARFFLDGAGRTLRVVVAAERRAVYGGRVASLAVGEVLTALGGHEILLGLRGREQRTENVE